MMIINRRQTSILGKDVNKPRQIGKKRDDRQKPGSLGHNQNRYTQQYSQAHQNAKRLKEFHGGLSRQNASTNQGKLINDTYSGKFGLQFVHRAISYFIRI